MPWILTPDAPCLEPFSCLLGDQFHGCHDSSQVSLNPPLKPNMWLQRLMHNLKQDITQPTTLFIDNHSAQLLARNPVNHNNMKHINVWHHFIRECVTDGSIILQSVASAENGANICTKPLGRGKFSLLHSMLCIVEMEDDSSGHSEGGGVLKLSQCSCSQCPIATPFPWKPRLQVNRT